MSYCVHPLKEYLIFDKFPTKTDTGDERGREEENKEGAKQKLGQMVKIMENKTAKKSKGGQE